MRRRSTCRLCGGNDLLRVLSLAPTPPANAFVPANALSRPQERFPLDVYFCRGCAHVQLLDVVDPRVLFEHYVYVSGTSPVFVRHFEEYANAALARFKPAADGLAVDIGSNDGTLLRFFKQAGMRVLGIDPARNIAEAATRAGIETWADFFSPATAEQIRAKRGGAAIVTANNVFAHADDLQGIAAGVRDLLAPAGVFVFEVSYLADVIEKTLFDTIYHEHLAYHSVKPLAPFFARIGLELFAAERVASHGGSLRGFVQRAGGPWRADGSVAALVALEEKAGLDRPETFAAFAEGIERVKHDLTATLKRLKREGKRIAGYGAPAKATTLMHHFGLDASVVDFIVDDSPLKQGLYSPGLHVPVVGPAAIAEKRPDCLLILAWNFAKPIMDKLSNFRAGGGRFIVPLPKVEVI